MPDSFSIELRSLLTGLLQRDVPKRLGCRGRGAEEIKSHPFFRGIDWRVVYLQRLSPPLIPARGEVNAADAFDIGSFDDEDTKHIKLTEADQELYRNFPVVVSERWQHEIAETIFDYINHEADKAEMKRKNKNKLGYQEEEQSDCILHGYVKRLGGTFTATWLTRYVRLYPNRLELWSDSGKQPELIFMDQIEEVCNDFVQIKNEQCIVIKLYNHSKYVLTNSDEIGLKEWHLSLKAAHRESIDMMTTMAEKATKIYGTEIPLKHMGKRRQQLQQENAAANAGVAPAASNWEQKIIQKELQASSSGKQPAPTDQMAPDDGRTNNELVTGTTAQAANNQKDQKSPQAISGHQHHHHHHRTASAHGKPLGGGQLKELQQQPHKHHRAHYSHRSHHHHHHRHHHHHHHEAHSADGGQQQVGSVQHQHHHGHHVHPAGQQVSQAASSAAAILQANQKLAEETKLESVTGQVEQPPAVVPSESQTAASEGAETSTPKYEEMAKPPPEANEKKLEKAETATKEQPNDEEQPASIGAEDKPRGKTDKRTESLLSSSSSASEVGSSSSTTESQSSCSSLDAPVDEIGLGLDKLQLAEGEITVDQDKPQASSTKTTRPDASPESDVDLGGQKQRIKLAVSLENVSDQQEVLRDPSKRITSDNKQREQDLVAQYEKLDFSARNSSSSQENEENLAVKLSSAQDNN